MQVHAIDRDHRLPVTVLFICAPGSVAVEELHGQFDAGRADWVHFKLGARAHTHYKATPGPSCMPGMQDRPCRRILPPT